MVKKHVNSQEVAEVNGGITMGAAESVYSIAQVRNIKINVTVYRSAANIRNNGAGAFVFALVCLRSLWMAK